MAVVLAVMALFILKVELPEGERKERESFVLRKMPDEKLTYVKLIGEKENFAFRKVGSEGKAASWQLDGTPEAQLDQSAVTALVKGLQEFKTDTAISADEVAKDLSVYGLGSPSAAIEVGEGGDTTVIKFGKSNDFIGKRYAQIGSADGASQIILVDDVLFNSVKKSKSDFREKSPIQFSDFSVTKVTLESPRDKTRMVLSQSDGVWKITEPVQADADVKSVEAFFRDLRGLKVAEFIDGVADRSSYGLDVPGLQIEIGFTGDRKPLLVAVADAPVAQDAKAKKSLYLSLGGSSVFKTTEGQVLTLRRSPLDFREKKLFKLAIDSVTKVDLKVVHKGISRTFSIEGSRESWKVNGGEGDAVFVRQLLTDISEIEAVDFPLLPLKETDLANPVVEVKVSVKDKEGKENIRELLIGREIEIPSGGRGYLAAERNAIHNGFIVSQETIEKLSPSEESLKKAATTPVPLETSVSTSTNPQ